MNVRLLRWLAPLGAGLCFCLALAGSLMIQVRAAQGGVAGLVAVGLREPVAKAFALRFALTLLLPFYAFAGLAAWALALAWLSLLHRPLTWRAGESFGLTASALLWMHLTLWWQVPATLALIPGLQRLPFWLLAILLGLGALAYPVYWIHRQSLGWLKGPALLSGWLLLWPLLSLAPGALPPLGADPKGGEAQASVLMIGLDGLQGELGQAATTGFAGTPYPNAYTVIPATRLLWNILWGGDPLAYTVGGVVPDLGEFTGATKLPLLEQASRQGWKPRFYIDDGGTLGLVGRKIPLDDLLMPAPGWENFVNSNLSGSFPLFAAWENWARPFPTTNPWAPLDAGLKEALRLGRGSRWVMFHSCLAHAPIYLRREELAHLRRWWTLAPAELMPLVRLDQVTVERLKANDPRRDPFLAYSLRMQAILKAWEPIWNGLGRDPHYAQATRVLFSDHGERFYPVTSTLRLGGMHGFNLDPWEARVMFKVAGPGFGTTPLAPKPATVSLLSLRDGVAQALAGQAMSPAALEAGYPEAPLRMHSLDLAPFTAEFGDYRHLQLREAASGITLVPGGAWFTRDPQTVSERSEDVSVAWGHGPDLEVVRPLKGGGAHRYHYEKFTLKGVDTLSEARYREAKTKVDKLLTQR